MDLKTPPKKMIGHGLLVTALIPIVLKTLRVYSAKMLDDPPSSPGFGYHDPSLEFALDSTLNEFLGPYTGNAKEVHAFRQRLRHAVKHHVTEMVAVQVMAEAVAELPK